MNLSKFIRNIALKIIHSHRKSVLINLISADYHKILEKKVIVVTGGSRGIGLAIAKKFALEGARVIITGRHHEALTDACKQIGNNAKMMVQDMSEVSDFNVFLDECKKTLGESISGIVLNAGISLHEGNFLNVNKEGFEKQIKINLESNYFLAQAFIREKLSKSESGNILFISSETAGKFNDLPYGLSKAAMNSLVGGLARRVYQRGVRINAIAPGVTLTNMKKGNEQTKDDYANSSVAGRFLLPEEIAEVACFMMSDLSKCISGEVIYCDAGSHLKINGLESEYSL